MSEAVARERSRPRLRVLGVFPHPDDEAYSCGGTLALLAAGGAEVQVLSATHGEAGQDLREVASGELGSVRAAELACACERLGIEPPRLLGLPDGGLDRIDFAEAAGQLVAAMRHIRPHIVLSLGPDGAYGHPDHIALHRLVVAAHGAAGGGIRFPADAYGEPWAPQRLFFAAFPRGMFRAMYDHMLGSEYRSAIRGLDPEKLGVEPPDVAAAVDIRPVAERKLAAIACHRSQLRGGDPYTLFPGDLVRRLLTTELFVLGAGERTSRLSHLDDGLDVRA